MRILIVDDEELSLSSVKRLLQWRGIRDVDVCNNGREAIRRIREVDYDVVLLDPPYDDPSLPRTLDSLSPPR